MGIGFPHHGRVERLVEAVAVIAARGATNPVPEMRFRSSILLPSVQSSLS